MYIAFLRGINVSGKKKIEMKALANTFEKLGFGHVKTYLNTGNVLFEVEESKMSPLIGKASSKVNGLSTVIKQSIQVDFDLEVEVIVKETQDIKNMIKEYPFESVDGKNRYVAMLWSEANQILSRELDQVKTLADEYEIKEDLVNLYIPKGFGKSKISNNFIEKKGHVVATTRNVNTLEKILKLIEK